MRGKDARSLTPEAQEALRQKAVAAVRGGMTQVEAAEVFGVTRQAIGNWVKRSRAGGRNPLGARRRGRPPGGSLLPWQAAQIAKAVIDHHPEQLKLPFYLWTREAVQHLIEERFGKRLSVWSVGRYLKRWGFTPQKPLRRAYERNPDRVRHWLKKQYPAIRARAKREGAQIFWGDEMGVRSDHAAGRSYGRRGESPVIPGTGQRFRCNMISAITNRGKLYFMVFTDRFDANVFIAFLRRLLRQVPRRVYLIIDRHPVHRSRKVQKWLASHADRIRVHFLPPYSPELNPDELLNQDVKSNAVGRKRPHNLTQMIQSVRSYLRSRQRTPKVVARFFRERHVRYAAT